jgi:UDP-N-acetylglucosamine 2-epimerase (non-hydrolysing)
MPEEINRLVTDRLSDLLLAPDRISVENLKAEGIHDSKIRFVGNIMIDTLEANRLKALQLDINEIIIRNLINTSAHLSPLTSKRLTDVFAVITIHRPANVDVREVFEPIIKFLKDEVARDLVLIWPVHPRAKKRLMEFGLYNEVAEHKKIILLEPVGYLDMLRLNMEAKIMLTDSGGLQEECTILGTPCLTLRWNTERPVTLKEHGGVSILVGNKIDKIRSEYNSVMDSPRISVRPELWDGHTAERCLKAILEYEI